ncbi:aldehyde dehydrogenase family protein [Solibacillus sp. FSL K6-1523]|uniref:aldehyde dehydrogenase family protein n=1 Tax=Solibacillus sp. FSL K6-1523 TaxID=2921471 RepID=UPI0030F8812A
MVAVIAEKLHEIFEKQSKYQWEARKSTAKQRADKLTRLKEAIIKRVECFVNAANKDFMIPASTVQNQIYSVIHAIDYAIENVENWMKPERVEQPQNGEAYILYEARGRVCIFGTWNSPMSVTIYPLAEALAAGNCVVIKPSEFNPNHNKVLQEVIESVFEEREVALVQGEADVSEQLLKLPFDHFFFTGSPRVGKIVMREAANHLAAVTLELGGKSPAIIEKGYDLEKAVQNLVFGKVLMGGQFCISPDYICVHEDDVTALAETYRQKTLDMLYDEGKIRLTERTQIVNEQHYKRLKNLFEDALAKGAVILSGGTFDDENRLIEPTLLGGVTGEMLIAEEEIFGPLTFAHTYTDVSEVLQYIQLNPKPLALYMFSDQEEFQQQILASTSSGGVTINGIFMHNVHLSLPFGGVNNSGNGSFHGIHGFKTFSHNRAIYKVD